MPKTILLPEQLVSDKTKWPKVIVRHEVEFRDAKGNLLYANYQFIYNDKSYNLFHRYKCGKCVHSHLY